MQSLAWLALAALYPVVASGDDSNAAGQFFTPPNAVHGSYDYSKNPVYVLGEIQTIKFTTIYPNYAINLWQQILGEGAAIKGPSIFSVDNGAVTQFEWSVQAYQSDLSFSNVFFFWLTSTSPPQDGSEPNSVTSHYFNLTDKINAPASSSTAPSLTLTSLSITPLSSTTGSPTTTSLPTATSSETPTTSLISGKLSSGAKAGIGVGAALISIATVVLASFLLRRSRQKRSYQASGHPIAQEHSLNGEPPGTQQLQLQGYKTQMLLAELVGQSVEGHTKYPIELSATGQNA
ncbi:hypothetical protein F5Y19DRAFT_438200 [Xylariaceae sp. FL1651]|nr:hypothetical protein F5Y19DRAFT_438200 [Xylariaceae sp. FL1651]